MVTSITAQTFDVFDRDSNGVLDENELNNFCRATGQNASAWDANLSGDVRREEFETGLRVRDSIRSRQSSNGWRKSDFHAIDSNHDGVLTRDEWERFGLDTRLFTSYAGTDNQLTHEEWDSLIERIEAQSRSGGGGKK